MKIISDAFPPTKPLHSLPPSRSTLIMANHCTSLCLIGFMDHLWFHQIVLFPEPPSSSSSNYKSPVTLGEEEEDDDEDEEEDTDSMLLVTSSEIDPPPPSSPLSVLTNLEGMDSNEEDGEKMIMGYNNNPLPSSSLSSKKGLNYVRVKSKKKKRGGSVLRSKSCGSRSWELELEEVKGFMDLGFKFEKEQLNPELLSVVPGLQRFSSLSTDSDEQRDQGIGGDLAPVEDERDDDDDYGVGIMRPYLSEAWLIRRPDSPLLNLKMPPRVSDAADMKKHLRCWARTVASVVLQD